MGGKAKRGIDGDGVCYMLIWDVRMVEVEEGDGSELENELRYFYFSEGKGLLRT